MITVTLNSEWYVVEEFSGLLLKVRNHYAFPNINDLRNSTAVKKLDYGNCIVIINGLEYYLLKTDYWFLYVELI